MGRNELRSRPDCRSCIVAMRYPVMWQSVVRAPFEQDIELAVIDEEGVHALVFPCQRIPHAWVNAMTGEILDVHPTHWRAWLVQQFYVVSVH